MLIRLLLCCRRVCVPSFHPATMILTHCRAIRSWTASTQWMVRVREARAPLLFQSQHCARTHLDTLTHISMQSRALARFTHSYMLVHAHTYPRTPTQAQCRIRVPLSRTLYFPHEPLVHARDRTLLPANTPAPTPPAVPENVALPL